MGESDQGAGTNQMNDLLKLVMIEKDIQISVNGDPSDPLPKFGTTNKIMHKSMINDLDWAPIAGRSFHLIVSCSKDQQVIVWRLVMMDIFSGELLDQPEFTPIQCIGSSELNEIQVQRVKWNILGTSFATSSDDGSVKVWQRSVSTAPS